MWRIRLLFTVVLGTLRSAGWKHAEVELPTQHYDNTVSFELGYYTATALSTIDTKLTHEDVAGDDLAKKLPMAVRLVSKLNPLACLKSGIQRGTDLKEVPPEGCSQQFVGSRTQLRALDCEAVMTSCPRPCWKKGAIRQSSLVWRPDPRRMAWDDPSFFC